MRERSLFNEGWLFAPEKLDPGAPDDCFDPVTLPHPNIILPHHNFRDTDFQFISTYRRRFTLSESLVGKRLYLDFDGVMTAATVNINGYTFPEQRGGYVPFSYDITAHAQTDGENVLTVIVDSTERADIPPFGGRVDYLTFGGIYRDVYLRTVSDCHIQDVFIKPQDLLTSEPKVEMQVTVRNQTDETQQVVIVGTLEYWRDEMEVIQIPPQGSMTTSLWSDLKAYPHKDSYLWSINNPKLHRFNFRLFQMKGFNSMDEKQLDALQIRTGFREALFKDDGFYLNGEKIKLIGLNRHQTFPYIGGAAPARLQRHDAELVKYDLGCNIVRTSHYPQSPHFLDRCDEIGLLVLEEIPGWQHIGDEYWQQLSLRDVSTMIERDHNHPSIILWGVRINESPDNHDFYAATNRLARDLDPTRQTTGIRNFQDSEFLEDVFCFNDFSNGIDPPQSSPHFITEFNGHMFPTKTWDNEERQVEHAIRHAHIQNLQFGHPSIAGAIGWCAFDYNTHKDFGSGDHMCYHGVMDIFRLPKYAAFFYASQVSPQQKPVLQAATQWTMGDRSAGGNNPVVVLSNVDEVEMFVGEELIGRFPPARDRFPNLPHPPFIIPVNMEWGKTYGNLLLIGYVDDKPVCEQQIALDGVPEFLRLETAHSELQADGMDMTWAWFHVVDLYNNRLPFSNTIVTFEISGPGELIGENPFPLMGGQAGLLVRAGKEAGTITIRASAPRLKSVHVTIKVE